MRGDCTVELPGGDDHPQGQAGLGRGRHVLRAHGSDRCDDRHGRHQEETFGPVAPIYRFKTDDVAIQMANDAPSLTPPRAQAGKKEGSPAISPMVTELSGVPGHAPKNVLVFLAAK